MPRRARAPAARLAAPACRRAVPVLPPAACRAPRLNPDLAQPRRAPCLQAATSCSSRANPSRQIELRIGDLFGLRRRHAHHLQRGGPGHRPILWALFLPAPVAIVVGIGQLRRRIPPCSVRSLSVARRLRLRLRARARGRHFQRRLIRWPIREHVARRRLCGRLSEPHGSAQHVLNRTPSTSSACASPAPLDRIATAHAVRALEPSRSAREPRPNLRLSAVAPEGETSCKSEDWSGGGNWKRKFSGPRDRWMKADTRTARRRSSRPRRLCAVRQRPSGEAPKCWSGKPRAGHETTKYSFFGAPTPQR